MPVEAALVLVTVTLNVGPHIGTTGIWPLIIYDSPPLMIAAIVGLHAFASSEYATMIGDPLPCRTSSHPHGRRHARTRRRCGLTAPGQSPQHS